MPEPSRNDGMPGRACPAGRSGKQGMGFYVEVCLLVVFLLFSSVVLVKVFAASKARGANALQAQEALLVAQDASESFAASGGDEAEFISTLSSDAGISLARQADGTLCGSTSGYDVEVAVEESPAGTGSMKVAHIAVSRSGDELAKLDSTVYASGRG